jgi:hypothetical protein
VRAGKTSLTTTPTGAAIDHAREVFLSSIYYLMCSVNGAIYTYDLAGGWVLRYTGTAGSVWDFAQAKNASGNEMVYCTNGVDPAQKWSGSATTSAWTVTSGTFPPVGGRLLVWRNRLVIIGGALGSNASDTLYLAQPGDPEAANAAYDFLQLRGDDDDSPALTDLNVLADRLYVFKKRSVWMISDPTTLLNRHVGEPGCHYRFQSDVLEEKLYFFNVQGLWSTAGVAVALESGSITNYFPQHLNVAQVQRVRVLATRDSYQRLLLTLPVDGSATNNRMIELVPHINFRRIGGRRYLLLPAFMVHDFDAQSLAAWKQSATSQWGVYGGGPAGKLFQYFNGSTDDGTAITARWKSSWMAIQGEEPFERVRRLNVELSGDAVVDVFKDFNQSPDFSEALPNPPLTPGDVPWDGGTWDAGVWDPIPVYRFARVRPESRGRFHQLQFRTIPTGQPFLINTAEFAIRGGKEH